MSYDFDLFTIGAGSGGVAASRRAATYGARVGICEGSRVGGTCVIRGCVPKKLLVYAAQFADGFADSAGFGWQVDAAGFDWPTLITNKNREIDRLNGIYIGMLEKAGVEQIEGWGRITAPHTIEITRPDGSTRRVTAERILIATGGRAVRPEIPGAELAVISDDALDLPELPRRVAIIGGGYIAVEFASIFAGLGSEVSLVLRAEAVLRGFDEDVRAALGVELQKRGINLMTGARPAAIERTGDGLVLSTDDGRNVAADLVLAATGRRPNTAGLGLEEVGVELEPNGGIKVDGWSHTTAKEIYAVGDVTGRVALTPVAIAEGRAFAETRFNDNPVEVDYRNIPSAVFAIPPVGTVGLTERQARAQCAAVDVYRSNFRPMKHTLSGREERTLMKLVVDRATDRVLGCHMVGADAPEIVQGLAIALNCGATKRQFDRTIGLHPSAAEEFVTMRERMPDPVAEAAE